MLSNKDAYGALGYKAIRRVGLPRALLLGLPPALPYMFFHGPLFIDGPTTFWTALHGADLNPLVSARLVAAYALHKWLQAVVLHAGGQGAHLIVKFVGSRCIAAATRIWQRVWRATQGRPPLWDDKEKTGLSQWPNGLPPGRSHSSVTSLLLGIRSDETSDNPQRPAQVLAILGDIRLKEGLQMGVYDSVQAAALPNCPSSSTTEEIHDPPDYAACLRALVADVHRIDKASPFPVPADITVKIMLHLDARDLARFAMVSKGCRKLAELPALWVRQMLLPNAPSTLPASSAMAVLKFQNDNHLQCRYVWLPALKAIPPQQVPKLTYARAYHLERNHKQRARRLRLLRQVGCAGKVFGRRLRDATLLWRVFYTVREVLNIQALYCESRGQSYGKSSPMLDPLPLLAQRILMQDRFQTSIMSMYNMLAASIAHILYSADARMAFTNLALIHEVPWGDGNNSGSQSWENVLVRAMSFPIFSALMLTAEVLAAQ
eukprot:jgi/Chlat1/7175/Chrsp57S06842